MLNIFEPADDVKIVYENNKPVPIYNFVEHNKTELFKFRFIVNGDYTISDKYPKIIDCDGIIYNYLINNYSFCNILNGLGNIDNNLSKAQKCYDAEKYDECKSYLLTSIKHGCNYTLSIILSNNFPNIPNIQNSVIELLKTIHNNYPLNVQTNYMLGIIYAESMNQSLYYYNQAAKFEYFDAIIRLILNKQYLVINEKIIFYIIRYTNYNQHNKYLNYKKLYNKDVDTMEYFDFEYICKKYCLDIYSIYFYLFYCCIHSNTLALLYVSNKWIKSNPIISYIMFICADICHYKQNKKCLPDEYNPYPTPKYVNILLFILVILQFMINIRIVV